MSRPSASLWLVFCLSFAHTQGRFEVETVKRDAHVDWKTLLAYVTGSVDEQLLLRIEYLVAENRILRDQIKGYVHLSDAERVTLAKIGQRLGKKALEEVAK